MKKILFGITGLTIGGAERVLVDLVNKLCDDYDITIFTIYPKGELEKELNQNIKLKSLYNKPYKKLSKIGQKIFAPLKVLLFENRIYKKYIKENYDVEIAFLEGPITRLFSVKNKDAKKIVWIHNDISKVFGNGIKAKLKKNLDGKTYSKYDELVFVSKDNLDKFNKVYSNLDNENINKKVIYNYIDKERILQKSCENVDVSFNDNNINFVSVARLVEQKGVDRLIKVHKKLIESGYMHNFYVIGDGPEKEKLEKLIKENDVEKTFYLLGQKENPYPYIKNSTYFCLLSRFEGYGMVLEEAKILNKPIIITNTAAREAVENYNNKFILENTEDGIYNGLKDIIAKETEDKKEKNKNDGEQNEKGKKSEEIETNNYDNLDIIRKVKELIGE